MLGSIKSMLISFFLIMILTAILFWFYLNIQASVVVSAHESDIRLPESLETLILGFLFNKNIKKQVKQLPLSERNVSSLKLILRTSSRLGADIKIGWKRDYRWNERNTVRESIKELISNMGYNTDFLDVT